MYLNNKGKLINQPWRLWRWITSGLKVFILRNKRFVEKQEKHPSSPVIRDNSTLVCRVRKDPILEYGCWGSFFRLVTVTGEKQEVSCPCPPAFWAMPNIILPVLPKTPPLICTMVFNNNSPRFPKKTRTATTPTDWEVKYPHKTAQWKRWQALFWKEFEH